MHMTSTFKKVFVAGLLAGFAGCKCGETTNRRFPKIEVLDEMGNARTSVDFGRVQMSFTATKKVRIRNSGSTSLGITAVTFSKPLFALADTLPIEIGVNEEYELPLTFTPGVADQRETGTATIASDDPNTPTVELSLAGTGVTATAVVQPTALDFGEVYVGEKKELSFALTNSGSNELPVTSASFSAGLDPSVTSDLAALVKTLGGGETAMVTVKYEPTQIGALMGDLEIVLPAGVGNKTIPVRGSAIQAQPKLCFKFDDSPTEQCTDGTLGMSLDLRFGTLCDSRVYPPDAGLTCELDGGAVPYERSGVMFVRNDGNTPVSYTLSITAGQPSRCDGGASIDFTWANAPLLADGGLPPTFMVPTSRLPNSVMDPRDWRTPPVAVTYRASSACRGGDDTDLSTIVWTRQGEPLGTMRRPNTMLATLSGNSLLADPLPFPVTFTGNSPMPQDVSLVVNTGDGPVRLRSVELWQSADGGLTPGVRCSQVDAGACTHFEWVAGPTLPVLLEGTNVPGVRVSKVVGRLAYGELTDAGEGLPMVYVPPSQEQRVWAIVETSDPYVPTVTVPIIGRLQ
jgi:hypothetical protein